MQLNLLPDVKLEYLRARRSRQLITIISIAVTAVSVAAMVLLLLNVKVLQHKHLGDLDNDIQSMESKLKSNTNLNKVLTIQNQLNSLPALDDQKPQVSLLLGLGSSDNTNLATPTITSAKSVGDAGTTAYGYKVSAVNAQGETFASTEAIIKTGNAKLDSTNYNLISWNGVPGATSYRVYGRTVDNELYMAEVGDHGTGAYTYADMGKDKPSGAQPASPGFLVQVTPDKVSIGELDADFTADTLTIKGTADTLFTVNKYVDTLKFTTYKVTDDTASPTNAFTNVVLSDFSYAQGGSVTYTITCNYNPDLLNIQKQVTLNVPKNFITTRSEVDKPHVLFNGKTAETEKQQTSNQ